MLSRMEQISEDVAIRALRKIASDSAAPVNIEDLVETFHSIWPISNSQTPMKDAISAAANAANQRSSPPSGDWNNSISQIWPVAVKETIEEYKSSARHSFKNGQPPQGTDTLSNTVRATLAEVATAYDWPHNDDIRLFEIAAALGSDCQWPATLNDYDHALANLSEEGKKLGGSLGASIGLADSFNFGTYNDIPDDAEESGFIFAEEAINSALRLHNKEPK